MPNSAVRTPSRRWAVPVAIVTVAAGAAVAGPLIAGADSELPDRTAAELLVDLATLDVQPFAGTVVQSADLGLPALTGDTPTSASAAAVSLFNGSTTARVWYTDAQTYRFALQDELAESDLVRDGSDLWFWSSESGTASHLTLPDAGDDPAKGSLLGGLLGGSAPDGEGFGGHGAGDPFGGELPDGIAPTAAASMALQLIAPTTQVEVDGTATVAGRSAYELVLSPRDEQSLIGSIRLAVDGENSMPLRVQVFDRDGGDPAIEVGFTSVSFAEPDRSVYDFTPPPGTEVEEIDPAELADTAVDHHELPEPPADLDPSRFAVVGSGWSSVAVLGGVDLDEFIAELDGDAAAVAETFVAELTDVTGPYGSGRALTSDLVTVLLLDDGRLLVGAVPLEVLEEAAMDPAAAL